MMKFLEKYKKRISYLQELREMEGPEDVECDYLAEFVKTSRKKQIIPELEGYIARHKGSPFWGYHFLLHCSYQMEDRESYKKRVQQAEQVLNMDEISILFPEPRFKDPSGE